MPEQGRVKWFDERKGYGFIETVIGGDIFVHFSGIEGSGFKTLREDDNVVFEVEESDRGKKAVRVSVITEETE